MRYYKRAMAWGCVTFKTEYNEKTRQACIYNICVLASDTGEITHYNNVSDFVRGVAATGLTYVYVYDGTLFMGFLDYWATRENLPTYESLTDDSGKKKRMSQECWSYTDGAGVCYCRKFWIKCRQGTTRASRDRHLRLRAFSIYNFKPLIGRNDFAGACEAFGITLAGDEITNFSKLIINYNELYKSVCGSELLKNKRPAVWTVGGAARRSYLTQRYRESGNPLKKYQYDHPFSELAETHMRAGKLLLSGLLLCAPQVDRKYYKGQLYKYDANSLYPYIMSIAPELGRIERSTETEYYADSNGRTYEYIIVFTRLELAPREGMPKIFYDPFNPHSKQAYISIHNEYYIFSSLWERLQKFYNIYDYKIARVLKCKRINDPVLKLWAVSHYEKKNAARLAGNEPLAKMYKLFVNNLGGKFLQQSMYEIPQLKYDEITDTVEHYGDPIIKNDWEKSHFDFVRGAYIYVLARCYMLDTILKINTQGKPLNEVILYCDTDSILTPLPLPAELVSNTELGKFKLERELSGFCALACKTYIEVLPCGGYKITAAGINKDSLRQQMANNIGVDNLDTATIEQVIAEFSSRKKYDTKLLQRVKGGNAYTPTCRKLGEYGITSIENYIII